MIRVAAAFAVSLFAAAPAWAAGVDGAWVVAVSCPAAADAAGYVLRFPAMVTAGSLEAEHGAPGAPGFLHLSGRLGADGTGTITADGLVGSARVAVGRLPAATPYHYVAAARFTPTRGTALRTTTRPCTLDFTRP